MSPSEPNFLRFRAVFRKNNRLPPLGVDPQGLRNPEVTTATELLVLQQNKKFMCETDLSISHLGRKQQRIHSDLQGNWL